MSKRIRFEIVFGHCIKLMRESHGWTQTELARRAGCEQPIVSQWESGRNLPDQRRLDPLLEALGVDGLTIVPRLVEAAMALDREAADLTDSRGRGVGDVTLLPVAKQDDDPPPPPPRRRAR